MLCVWQVNSLGEELMKEFEELYTKFSTDSAATAAVLISGKPGCFIAGADIKVIKSFIQGSMIQMYFNLFKEPVLQ
jgi:enoyl-CoA hydratase/carnithine racemase